MAYGWNQLKYQKGGSKYKYVHKYLDPLNNEHFFMVIDGIRNGYDTEKDAAKAVDIYLIKKGKQPVNILIPKKK